MCLPRKPRKAVDLARQRLADLIGCEPSEIVFASGGTESNNAVIHSALQFEPSGKHVVTSAVEHSAVLRLCQNLEKRGCFVTFLGVNRDGNLDLAELEAAIGPETAVVSMMWANNETGVLFPVEKIAEICREKGVLFHTDAVQVVGKIPICLRDRGHQFLVPFRSQISWSKRRGRTLCEARNPVSPVDRRRRAAKRSPGRDGKCRVDRRPWKSCRARYQISRGGEMQHSLDSRSV